MQPNMPQGNDFITVEEAIKLIQSDTREDAKVDLQFMVNNIPYLKPKQLFNIRLLKTTEDGKVVRNGTLYVRIMSKYDKEVMLRALQDAYNARTGILVDPDSYGLNRVSTTIDEEKGKTTAQPRGNTESKIGFRDQIGDNNEQQVLQGV